jgi:hypothetical protein
MKTHSISFAVSQNEIAYAVFDKQKLIFWEVYACLSDPLKIPKSAVAIVQRCFERFNPNAGVFETINADDGGVAELHALMKNDLHRLGIPVFETREEELLKSFGFTALKDRQELRRATAAIFPEMPLARYMHPALDAAALGLHFETRRLLSLNSTQQ